MFDALREDIISLVLKPGTVLSRNDLQERFGLSSTPIRDALMKLQTEALVDVFPQHATVVSPIDLTMARQAQFLRRSLESELVRVLALSGDKTVVAKLRSIVRQSGAFAKLGEIEAFANTDLMFHRAMFDAQNVPELWHLVRRQSGHIDRLRRLNLPVAGKMRGIVRDHEAIVDAIETGKAEAAQKALRDHLSGSLDFVDKLRETHPEYFRE